MSPVRESKLRIIVLGYVIRRPLGGGTWPTLQYALGLLQLGHDVYFLEDSDDYESCYDPSRHVTDCNPSFGLQYALGVFARTDLAHRWAYHDAHTQTWHGPRGADMVELCKDADLVINVSGINPIRPWLEGIARRAYIDTDPGFEQIRQHDSPSRRALANAHNVFFTLGENIPSGAAAQLPDLGVPWQPTRQPVVLDCWPVTPVPSNAKFTTVMLWDSYETRQYGDLLLGMKSASFEPFWTLPTRCGAAMELAVGGPNVPRERLRDHGWSVIHALEPTQDPWTYQSYMQQSIGEFSIAKQGYVATRCGWFSERSAHYLASGRAVITQDTGFPSVLPTGEGLFAFHDLDTAMTAIEAVRLNPQQHGDRARQIAAEYFDARRVLADFVARAMSTDSQGEAPQ